MYILFLNPIRFNLLYKIRKITNYFNTFRNGYIFIILNPNYIIANDINKKFTTCSTNFVTIIEH